MPATTFTRYTVAPSTVSRTSKYVNTKVQGDSFCSHCIQKEFTFEEKNGEEGWLGPERDGGRRGISSQVHHQIGWQI